jgi:hypothetical protein
MICIIKTGLIFIGLTKPKIDTTPIANQKLPIIFILSLAWYTSWKTMTGALSVANKETDPT